MPSEVEIANLALTVLGEGRISSLDDNNKPAREIKAVFAMRRDKLLGRFTWSFSKARAMLPALVETPAFQFEKAYQLPSDCLRVIMLNEIYVGLDMTNYRGSPTEEYAIEEGNKVLTNWGPPLPLRYVKRITDTNKFNPCFATALAADIAYTVAEALTQSEQKQARAESNFKREIRDAVVANAIELPPSKLADDEWLLSRL